MLIFENEIMWIAPLAAGPGESGLQADNSVPYQAGSRPTQDSGWLIWKRVGIDGSLLSYLIYLSYM